jgi:hypothetical protein
LANFLSSFFFRFNPFLRGLFPPFVMSSRGEGGEDKAPDKSHSEMKSFGRFVTFRAILYGADARLTSPLKYRVIK